MLLGIKKLKKLGSGSRTVLKKKVLFASYVDEIIVLI